VPATAPDDVVHTFEGAERNARPPLLVAAPLGRFLDEHGLGTGPIEEVAPVGEGHSNVTYLIRREGWEGIVRRPPRPPLSPSAHDGLREARVLRAIAGAARVPRVLAATADLTIIGAPFYVMARAEGHVVTASLPPAHEPAQERRRMAEELVDALVEIHAVDWRAAGLHDFRRPTDNLERQLRRFSGLWERTRTRELPSVERVGDWLRAHLPESGDATVVHGDFRLGNVMFGPSAPARIVAVFDWEMATLGDPLADIGYLAAVLNRTRRPVARPVRALARHAHGGLPVRGRAGETLRRAQRPAGPRPCGGTGRWRPARRRVHGGQLPPRDHRRHRRPFLRDFGDTVVELAERAQALASGGR